MKTDPATALAMVTANPHWYRMKPDSRPDLSDPAATARWIEHARNAAFLCGARGEEISAVEAALLCMTTAPKTGANRSTPQE